MFFSRKAYFRTVIDFNWEVRKEGRRLTLMPEHEQNMMATEILDEAQRIIIDELPWELKKAYNLRVRTNITYKGEGSIIIVFSVAFVYALGIYYFIANYPSFKDGCRILREDLKRFLDIMLRSYSPDLESNVTQVSPRDHEFENHFSLRHTVVSGRHPNFFWPMMVSLFLNIVLAGLLLLIV